MAFRHCISECVQVVFNENSGSCFPAYKGAEEDKRRRVAKREYELTTLVERRQVDERNVPCTGPVARNLDGAFVQCDAEIVRSRVSLYYNRDSVPPMRSGNCGCQSCVSFCCDKLHWHCVNDAAETEYDDKGAPCALQKLFRSGVGCGDRAPEREPLLRCLAPLSQSKSSAKGESLRVARKTRRRYRQSREG